MICLKFCFFIALYLLLIDNQKVNSETSARSKRHSASGKSPVIKLSPTTFKPGITEKLTLTCSIDEDEIEENMSFVSLLASFKSEAGSSFNVLGVISSSDCDRPINGKRFTGKLTGHLDEAKGGFLTVEIPYPKQGNVGDYRCQVSTKDEFFVFSTSQSPVVSFNVGKLSVIDVASALAEFKTIIETKFSSVLTSIKDLNNKIVESNGNITKEIKAVTNNLYKNLTNYVDIQQNKPSEWITIQRRINGDIGFYRSWKEYKEGFGDKDTNFWIGLDNIHEMTKDSSELKIILKYSGKKAYAHYWNFRVGDEASGYNLSLGGYDTASTAGDSLIYHNGMKFSTRDKDNDKYPGNCASSYHGAFWYNKCHHVNLNGKWGAGSYVGLRWDTFTGANSATYTEMLIKKK